MKRLPLHAVNEVVDQLANGAARGPDEPAVVAALKAEGFLR